TPPEGEPVLRFHGERPRNVLMISIDTTRRDHVGSYSADGVMYTPFLEQLMTEGVRLDAHQQCSDWTFASTSCTMGGRYAEENGFIPVLIGSEQLPLPDGQRTIATRLRDLGFATILISSNGWLSAEWNNVQGYDQAPFGGGGSATILMGNGLDLLNATVGSPLTVPDGGTQQPWLLHVHFVEPHPPYIPPDYYNGEEVTLPPLDPKYDLDTQPGQYDATDDWPTMSPEEQDLLERHLRARYHGELRYLDDQIRGMWDTLEAGGWLDDTLVVVWTDHGEQFWERGHQSHAWNLGAEENDGVAFFWGKNLIPYRWTEPTSAVDLLPTVLEAVGEPIDPLDPVLSGYVVGTAPEGRPRFSHSVARAGVSQAVTLDDWKLVFNFNGTLHLYDRKADPYELVDLYSPTHPQVAPLWALLRIRVERMHQLLPTRPLTWPVELPSL
ncbi:MAG: sulfatase-like hydrolase/transferase, partial [Myxococcota bacterium]